MPAVDTTKLNTARFLPLEQAVLGMYIYNWVIFQKCICKLSCLELRKHFPTEVILEKRVPFLCQNIKPDLEHSASEIAIQIDYGDIHGKCDGDPPNLELGILGTQ